MKYLELYLIAINVLAFSLMGQDKSRAKKNRWRIPEKVLFGSAILGGSIGAILGMQAFRHKTKHMSFVLGMPLILVLQLILVFVLWKTGLRTCG